MKRSKPPRRKTKARKLNQTADLLMRERIFDRDGRRCVAHGEAGVSCMDGGAGRVLQSCHILPKGKYQRLRWHENNLLTMCYFHHIIWSHKDPLDFARFIRTRYPGREEELREIARNAPKVDVRALIEELSR